MDYDILNYITMYHVNLLFCLIIIVLCIKKYRETGSKAFLFIAAGFVMQGSSHFALAMGWAGAPEVLIAIRLIGYSLFVIGMIV